MILNFELDGIKDINKYSLDEIVSNMEKKGLTKASKKYSVKSINKIMKLVMDKVNLKPDQEQYQFIMCDNNRILCEATAGSGKTTMSEVKVIREKLINGLLGKNCLALAYNEHTAKDMSKRHEQLVSTMRRFIGGTNCDSDIVSRTFHSNAIAWLEECGHKVDVINVQKSLLTESDRKIESTFMKKVVTMRFKKKEIKREIDDLLIVNLLSMDAYVRERMFTKEEYDKCEQFSAIDLAVDEIEDIFTYYRKLKMEINDKLDFTDVLCKFYELLRDHEDVRKRVQSAYNLVVLDEYQDMSELMNKCLELMLGEDTKFIAIGDSDQAIYGFRGTTPMNCLKFKEHFPDGVVLTMGQNRRCSEKILDFANNLISTNSLRYPKDIYTNKKGGSVTNLYYKTSKGQIMEIIKRLKDKPVEELNKVCITYRNKESSYMVTRLLLENRIPFIVKSGFKPYSDVLSKSLYSAFNMLRHPTVKVYQKEALAKLLPGITMTSLNQKIDKAEDGTTWQELDLAEFEHIRNFKETLYILKELQKSVREEKPMNCYFELLYNILCRHYWNFVKRQINFSEELEKIILEPYRTSMTFDEFSDSIMDSMELLRDYSSRNNGVYITTFHGLKGLEFDDVYIIDLEDNIFPNFKRVDSSTMSVALKQEAKEEAVRLFYVVLTRAKKSITAFWNNKNPSCMLSIIKRKEFSKEESEQDSDVSSNPYIDSKEDKDNVDLINLNLNDNESFSCKEDNNDDFVFNDLDFSEDDNDSLAVPKSNETVSKPISKPIYTSDISNKVSEDFIFNDKDDLEELDLNLDLVDDSDDIDDSIKFDINEETVDKDDIKKLNDSNKNVITKAEVTVNKERQVSVNTLFKIMHNLKEK